MTDLAARIRRLEDRDDIRTLVARYGFVIDDRDMAGIGALFTPGARFRSKDGVLDATGREAILRQFEGRFAVLAMTIHYTHDHVIWFEGEDRARGLVSSHSELVRHGKPMVVALRYEDVYERHGGAWKFADRLLSFCYYMDVREYADLLGNRRRMRAYETPAPADWPEGTESFTRYNETH